MSYATHLFDCDGVLLATNTAKAQAFYDVAIEYGEDVALALVQYHKTAGSIGRKARFQFLFDELLQREPEAGELESAMDRCTKKILASVKEAKLMLGVEEYLSWVKPSQRWVVSGIESDELKVLLSSRLLSPHFERVYGSPPAKQQILERICSEIERPAVFYGDAEEDYLCAVDYELDFVLIKSDSHWAEGSSMIEEDPHAIEVNSFLDLLALGVR